MRKVYFVISFVFFLVFVVRFAEAAFYVDDQANIINYNDEFQIDVAIGALEREHNVSIRLQTVSKDFGSREEFESYGRGQYSNTALDTAKNPLYNVFILYAKVNGKPYVGYFHSYKCKMFVKNMQHLASGEISRVSSKEFVGIVNNVINTIKDKISLLGDNCILNVCELIKEGKDERYKGFVCDEFDPNRPTDKYNCWNSMKRIKCLYAKGFEVMTEQQFKIKMGETAFLIDDGRWQDVLSLLPLSVYHFVPKEIETYDKKQEMNVRRKYVFYNPLLVYHREGEDVDIDSTLTFLKQYKPEKVIVVGRSRVPRNVRLALLDKNIGLGMDKNKLTSIKPEDYYKFWKRRGYDSLVISENDYKTGLIASLFASFMNAPVLFLDAENYREIANNYRIAGKEVYLVGHVDRIVENYIESKHPLGIERYLLSELMKKYAEYTNTDKAILVNPDDIRDGYCEKIEFTSQFGKVKKPFCRDSLAAPLLASVKNELIIFTRSKPSSGIGDYTEAEKNIIESEISSTADKIKYDVEKQRKDYFSNRGLNYLTVFASPKAIPISKYIGFYPDAGKVKFREFRMPLDMYYVDSDKNSVEDIPVGRVFGLTVSDSSSYVNRVVGFVKGKNLKLSYIPVNDSLKPADSVLLIASRMGKLQRYIPAVAMNLKDVGYDVSCFVGDKRLLTENNDCSIVTNLRPSILGENDIILYDDHGEPHAWSFSGIRSSDIPELHSALGIAQACQTMNYYDSAGGDLFGVNFIRKGGIGYFGFVSTTYYSIVANLLLSKIMKGFDLGNALKSSKEDMKRNGIVEFINVHIFRRPSFQVATNIMLLGDPTVLIAVKKQTDVITKKLPVFTCNSEQCGVVYCGKTAYSPEYAKNYRCCHHKYDCTFSLFCKHTYYLADKGLGIECNYGDEEEEFSNYPAEKDEMCVPPNVFCGIKSPNKGKACCNEGGKIYVCPSNEFSPMCKESENDEDRDGDGIINKDDECPFAAGVRECYGCPKIWKCRNFKINNDKYVDIYNYNDYVESINYRLVCCEHHISGKTYSCQYSEDGCIDMQGTPVSDHSLCKEKGAVEVCDTLREGDKLRYQPLNWKEITGER